MSKQIEIRILKLVDVDSFGSSVPFVRLTAPSGETRTSGTGLAEKDQTKYTFSVDAIDNVLTFGADKNPAKFAVAVLTKDTSSGQIIQYPGVGTINIFLDDANNNVSDAHCPLCEDGDEMLEIGALIYSYTVNEANTSAAADEQLDETDFNTASLEPSPRVDIAAAESAHAVPASEASKVKDTESFRDDMDAFDRAMMKEENMDEFLNDQAAEEDLFDINSLGPNEELIVAPELHIHPEHAHLDHRHDHEAAAVDKISIATPNEVHEVTLLPPQAATKPVDMREWMHVAECSAENLAIPDIIRADLANMGPQCNKIIVRLHSVIVSSHHVLETTTATAKLSIQPLPDNVVSLRSVSNKHSKANEDINQTFGTSSPQPITSNTSGKKSTSHSTAFSFGLKTAQLTLGPGDLRSKTYREGACPRLCLEIALGGSEPYTGFAELYLPTLLLEEECRGQVLSVPLVQTCRNDGDHTCATTSSTLLFELNPPDLMAAGSYNATGDTYTPRSTTNPNLNRAATTAAPNTARGVTSTAAVGASTKKRPTKASRSQAAGKEEKVKGGLIPNIPCAMDVELELSGVCGAALEVFPNLGATARLEAYLTASGCTETVSLCNLATKQNSADAWSIKKTFFLHSNRPKVDILQLRLRNGPFPEDEIGRFCVPLAALLQTSSEELVLNKALPFHAWKFCHSDKGTSYLSAKWKAVGVLRYQSAGPSPSQRTIGASTMLDTTGGQSIEFGTCTGTGTGTGGEFDGGQFSPDRTSAYPTISGANITSSTRSFGGNNNNNNNWMTSPSRRSPAGKYDSSAMGTTSSAVASSAKPTLVKSISGQLVVCVKGYFSARSVLDATGNQDFHEREGPLFLSRNQSLCVETTLLPEGLRKRTPSATATALQSGDIEATAAWGKSFSMFLAYATQQRPVPYLQMNLFAEKNATSTGTGNSSATPTKPFHKTLIGSSAFDVSSLLVYADSPLVRCLLPVTRAGVNPSFTVLNRPDVCGWLLVGLQFRATSAGGDLKADMDLAESAMQAQWMALSAFSTQYCLGLSTNADANAGAAIKALQANPQKLQKGSLHVALSALQFAAQTGSSNVQAEWEDADVTCLVKVGSDPDCSVQIPGAIQNDQVLWFKPDAVIKFTREASTSVCLYVYLIRGGGADAAMDTTDTAGANVVATATLTLSQEQLQKGLPINFSVPLRDPSGERSATLGMCVQLTTMGGDSADQQGQQQFGGDGNTSNFASATSGMGTNALSPVPLRVEFCEGNIADSDDQMEPFFECSLLLPENEELLAGPNYSTKARTGFLRLSDNLEYWGLDCTLHVPPASVASIGTATATMLATNRSLAGTNSANLNSGACIMGVVCRDASKQGCPEIGWARVALPRQLVLQGKPIEQWITLTPPSLSSSPGASSAPTLGSGSKHSRMKLRVTVDYKDYDAAYSPFGLGAVMFRIIGVHDARAGVNDDLVSARVSSYSWPDGVPTDVMELKEDNMFAQLNAHPAAYINEMSIFNEENLVGSLPVSGGFGEVKLNVKTFTTNTSYVTSFPIMATTTKATESSEMPPIPLLNLNLSRERTVEMISKDGTVRAPRARLEPQLQLSAAYVPYVTGKLVLHCTDVTLVTPPAETVPVGTVLKKVASPLAIRYLLGNNSSKFMFSRPFELSTTAATSTGGLSKPLQGPPALNQVNNVTFMDVNTFEIISNSIRRGENFSMLPLFVSLLEQWDLLDPAVGKRGQQSCIGVGYVSTAALYYQALRVAASTPMKPATAQASSNASRAGTATNFTSAAAGAGGGATAAPLVPSSTEVAASPWLVSKIDIYDPKSKLKVAEISLNIQFIMNSLPDHVARLLSNTVCKDLVDASAKAHIELGLKQSFVLADSGKTGAVSFEELLQVVKNSGRTRVRGGGRTRGAKSGRLMLTQKGETIGMENAVELLFNLANVSEAEMNAVDEQSLNDLVRKIFTQLDVDGDGLVSWWEWKCVLCASILGHNSASKFMYHMDALVIGAQAANDALKTLALTLPGEDNFANNKSGAQHSMLPYIKLKMKTMDHLSEPVIYEEVDGQLFSSEAQPASKTVSRLHSMVKSLRLTNSILAKRFERALSTAQNLSIDLDQDTALRNSASAAGASRQGAKLSEIEFLEARILDTERASEQNLTSFLTAKERADRLSAQLLAMKSTMDILEQSRSKPELFTFNSQLEAEIEENTKRLHQAQEMRRQRSSQVFSVFRLKALISKHLMPKVHQRRKEKAAQKIAQAMQAQAVRRNYLAEKEKRTQAALLLQGAGRGLLGRKRVKEMNKVATKTQNLFRGKLARRTLANLKEEKAQRDAADRERKHQIQLNMAAFVLTRFVRNCGHRNREVKDSAAARLQALLKKRLNFKAAKQIVNQKRVDRDERHAEEKRLAEELARMQAAERLRAEEERRSEEEVRRRQQAALKLTRALSMRSGMVEGRKIHAFLAAQKDLRQISRPDISAVPGNWVGYPQTMSTLPADVSETHSTFQHFGRGNFGNIQSIDVRTRIMDVLFLYNKVEGANSKSGAKFELVKMPYDHPLLDFYTTEPLPKPDQGYWVNYAEEGEHHWLPFKPYTDRPDLIEDTLGYKVGMRTADAADEGALYPGRVVAFDRIKETVSILFDPSSDTAADANTDPDQENVHWKSADIQWLMPATVSRPKTIEEAVGYNVEVNKAESTVEAHRAVRGTVIGYDRSRQTVRVVYAPPPGQAEATQVENLAFVSPLISWLNKVPLDQVPRSPRPYFPHAGPSYSKLVATTRPGDILSTVGHLVEVRSSDPDAEPGDMFSGVVIAADSSAGTVRILFDSLDKGGSRSRRQSIDAVQQAEGPDVSRNHAPAADDPDEDFEDFPWMSDDILWVIPESVAGGGGNGSSDGGIPIIDSRRPRTLADAVGLHVDVLSREPDAVEGDYFSGTVISVDDKQQTLRVLFDGEDNGDDDFEDIPWNSQDIHWVTEESLRGVGDALSQADSVSLMGPAQDSKDVNVPVRPTTVTEALGRAVKVGAEFTNGDIASVDAKSGAVWVVFNSVANAPAPVQVKIHWQAPHIEWLDSKPLAVVTPLPSPSGKAQLSSPPVEAATAEASLAPAATSTALAAATTSPVQPTTPTSGSPNKKLTRPLNLASSVGWTVEIRTSEAEDEVYVGEVAGYEEATQVVKVLFAGEDGALQQDDAEFFPFDSEKLHWVEAPEGQQQQMQIQMQVQQEGQQQPAEQAAALATTALATSEAAATADEKKVGSEKSPTTAAAPTAAPTAATPVVLTGEPASIEEAVGRHVNIVLDYVPGVVEAVSQALQTVNVTLENSSSSSSSEKLGMSETLILGLPLNSSMIEWDAK